MNAIVFGASGMTGRCLVELLPTYPVFDTILAASRSKPVNLPTRVTYHPFTTNEINVPANIDVVFSTLGTTMKKAGSRRAFEEVDLVSVLKIARLSLLRGATTFILVSSVGANARSSNFYLRTKGKLEDELLAMPFQNLYIARPSLLLGKRGENRPGEKLATKITPWFNFIFKGDLLKYKPIEAQVLAKALANLAILKPPTQIIETKGLLEIASVS